MDRRNVQSRGFTLLELVLVMIIMVVAVGMVAPKLANWNRGQDLRNAADIFGSITRLARSKAISDGVMYRIEFNSEAGQYQLKKQDKTQISTNGWASYVPIKTTMGQVFSVPEGGKIKLTVTTLEVNQAGQDTGECINFYPNGRSEKATVIISDKTGRQITIASASAMEEFRVVNSEENGQ